ncbi:MAG: hypothetical protein HMLKMBBP_01383 [Planctomycetes bacterium]|nr:hypothetical protein [Planctomycetota bacterium]
MNFLAHGLRSLGDPWECAGTAAPDLVRRVRKGARIREAGGAGGPRAESFARGVARHHAEDRMFHSSGAFDEAQRALTAEFAALRDGAPRFRARFLAHLAVEVLLDAWIEESRPGSLDRYYGALASVDAGEFDTLARAACADAAGVGRILDGFRRSQFLREYDDDARVAFRLSQVASSVGVEARPELLSGRIAAVRPLVRAAGPALLASVGGALP